MTLQDKYSRANSRRYRAAHGGIQSNRAKTVAAKVVPASKEFPRLEPSGSTDSPDDAEPSEDSDAEERPNFSRRTLASNLDRYHEPEPEPDVEPEPETDLSEFLKKQVASLDAPLPLMSQDNEDDVDHAFSHLFLKPQNTRNLRQISSDEASELVQLDDERRKADATRELRARFTGRDLRSKPQGRRLAPAKSPLAGKPPSTVGEDARSTALVGPLDDEAFLDEVLGDASGTYGNTQRKRRGVTTC
ncbi:hypothetical protein CROQUDRAFT_130696 [Cronartium quercuum f. sp. fusiforme G11]|uniref:Uncharacterized protein n=1 Tax=Cronartium quercuum f. sp. fusiforme G11 TaxID=708437 RepID=A0A9P6TGZ9_9BASI|nr:hypothetical protein CROQUDRAFT_130696 [Cronartium quercuum f. sp. fusiforme G11]